MKKIFILIIALSLSFVLSSCSSSNSNIIASDNSSSQVTLEDKYNAIQKDNKESHSTVQEKQPSLYRTSGIWHNIDDKKMVIEMTDNLYLGFFPNTEENDYYFYGKMTVKNGTEALQELKLDSIVSELEGVTEEDYYSIIVDIDKMAKAGIDVTESLTEESKAWYMLIFLKDDYIYVYDANNDTHNYFVKET